MIKKFNTFILESFDFVDILQDLKDEFQTIFEYHDREGNVHKADLDEFHKKMRGKYDPTKDGLWYCIHSRVQNLEEYERAYPIFLEIIDRMEENGLYPRNFYFYYTDGFKIRQYKKLPSPEDKSIPSEFRSIKLYFNVIKEVPRRSILKWTLDKINGNDHYKDMSYPHEDYGDFNFND